MFEKFQRRSVELERLDTGDYSASEYSRWQKEMWFIHRLFGERRALKHSLVADIRNGAVEKTTILDVGAGTGELTAIVKAMLNDRQVYIVGADISYRSASAIKSKGVTALMCDALSLPFDDNSFDHVFCSLTLHHFNEEDAVRLLHEMNRVARTKIFVIDLNRKPAAYYFYKLLGSILLQRFSRDDGALSILRSYTEPELTALAAEAGLPSFEVKRSAINRLILTGN